MSDQWNFYPCQMGDHPASVFYDEGVAQSLDATAAANLLAVRITMRSPYPNGLSSNEEFDALNAFEDALTEVLERHGAMFVGRITTDGHRHFYAYTDEPSEDLWAARIRPVADASTYTLGLFVDAEPDHRTYWNELYPKDADRRVMADLVVLRSLAENGDDGSTVRHVDHWAYFDDAASAAGYVAELTKRGYAVADVTTTDDGKHQVRFGHETALFLADITQHTVALDRAATALGGRYDGWETLVCRPN